MEAAQQQVQFAQVLANTAGPMEKSVFVGCNFRECVRAGLAHQLLLGGQSRPLRVLITQWTPP